MAPTKVKKTIDKQRERTQAGRREPKECKIERFLNEFIRAKLSKTTLETKRVDGDLLAEKVGKKIDEGNKRPLSQKFAEELLKMYDVPPDLFEGLDLPMTEKSSSRFVDDLDLATSNDKNVRSIEGILDYLQYQPKLSIKDFVGGMQTIFSSKKMSKSHKEMVYVEVMKHCAQHRIFEDPAYAHVLSRVQNIFQECMRSLWCKKSGRGQTWQVWLQRNKDIAVGVLNKADIEVVLAKLDNLNEACRQISRLYASGSCGEALFKEARDQLAGVAMVGKMEASLQKVIDANFSREAIAELKETTGGHAIKVKKAKVSQNRDVGISMLSMKGKITVYDANYQHDVHLQVAIRAHALGKIGGIPMLPHEDHLIGHQIDPQARCSVPEHLISNIIDYREAFLKDIKKKRARSVDDILDVLASHWEDYKEDDRWVVIDRAFLEKSRKVIDDLSRKAILQCLPRADTVARDYAPVDALMAIAAATETNPFKLASATLVNQVELLVASLELMKQDANPDISLQDGGEFLQTCFGQLQFFYTARANSNDALWGAPTQRGLVALKAEFDRVKEIMNELSDDSPIELDDIEQFQAFTFLVPPSDIQLLAQWVEKLLLRQSKVKDSKSKTGSRVEDDALETMGAKLRSTPSKSSSSTSVWTPPKVTAKNKEVMKYFQPRVAKAKKQT